LWYWIQKKVEEHKNALTSLDSCLCIEIHKKEDRLSLCFWSNFFIYSIYKKIPIKPIYFFMPFALWKYKKTITKIVYEFEYCVLCIIYRQYCWEIDFAICSLLYQSIEIESSLFFPLTQYCLYIYTIIHAKQKTQYNLLWNCLIILQGDRVLPFTLWKYIYIYKNTITIKIVDQMCGLWLCMIYILWVVCLYIDNYILGDRFYNLLFTLYLFPTRWEINIEIESSLFFPLNIYWLYR